jgi:hypothetical protein
VRGFLAAVPLSAFAFAFAIVMAVWLSPVVAGRLRTTRGIAALLIVGIGFVVAATLTPDADAFAGLASDGTCDVSRVWLAPIGELTRITSTSLNVLLFVPLGLAVGLLPRSRTANLITIAAVASPFVVEATQLLVTVLGRGCQTADIVDNLLGVAIGMAIGTGARLVLSRESHT